MTAEEVIKTDVLVVGAGPTGLLLANLLGAMGVSTTLVETHDDTVQDPRAVSIDDEAMRALQAAGLAGEIAAISVQGYGSIYRGPSGKAFASVMPTGKDYGFDKRNAFEQPAFEAVLRKALARYPHVTAHFGTEMTAFEQSSDSVQATVCARDAQEQSLHARYMVACDGGRSPVRKMLGIAMQGATFEEPWLIVDLKTTRNRCFHTEVFCDPARPCITLPGPGGIRRYEFKLHPGEAAVAVVQHDFIRGLLAAVGPDRDEAFRRVRVYTFHARIAERWQDGRVFLAGDAAHLTPPFAGQGMNSGLRDAHNLGWKLAEALHMECPKDLLASYEIERKPHAWSLIRLALRMGQVMMPASWVQGMGTRALFRLLTLSPAAREYVMQMKYKPKPRFEAGFIWHTARPRKTSVVGQMLPQPVVEATDRCTYLLDDVLGDRPTLLILSKQPDIALSYDLMCRFEALGIAVLGVTPHSMNPVATTFPVFRDKSRGLSNLPYAAYVGYGLLIRRDRYIAAARPVAQLEGLLEIGRHLSPGRVVPPTTRATTAAKGADQYQAVAETA
jgi:3-(3-hydroxy-phenyl)propionate hydroxylase